MPYNLALLRVIFFTYTISIYLKRYHSALPTVSLSNKVALPYIGWLIDIIPVNASIYTVFVWLGRYSSTCRYDGVFISSGHSIRHRSKSGKKVLFGSQTRSSIARAYVDVLCKRLGLPRCCDHDRALGL